MLKTWSTNAEIPGQEVIRNPKHHIGSNVCMQYVCIFFFGLAFIRLYQNCSLTNLTFYAPLQHNLKTSKNWCFPIFSEYKSKTSIENGLRPSYFQNPF